MPVSYTIDKPATPDADGIIRRSVTVTATTVGGHSPMSKRYAMDDIEAVTAYLVEKGVDTSGLTDQQKIDSWGRYMAGNVYAIMQSRFQSDQDSTTERDKWDTMEEEDTGPLPG